MQNTQKITESPTKNAEIEISLKKMSIDVTKPFQHKQIDTRWVELKMNNKLLARSYFASCIQAGKVYLHGGYNQEKGILSDMYTAQFYDLPSDWTQIKPKSNQDKNPPGLRNHTLCAFTSYLILIGGQMNMLENNKKLYRFDLRTNEWSELSVIPKNSSKQISFALDSHVAKVYNDYLYVFGGYQSEKGVYSNQIIKLHLVNIAVGQIQAEFIKYNSFQLPHQRGNLSACVMDAQMYMFGGTDSDKVFDDFWVFNFQQETWKEIKPDPSKEGKYQWPERRKGHIMAAHQKSRVIFMFGGIKQITKQQNDIMVFLVSKGKWVRIHKSTNDLYQPSPTIKKQLESSPTIIEAKNKKNNKSKSKSKSPFKLGIKSVTCYNKTMTESYDMERSSGGQYISTKTQYGGGFESPESKKRMSVVQEKKYREFMNRKKKLLSQVNKNAAKYYSTKRSHSPTSQTLSYCLESIGQQKKGIQTNDDLPKVIFDEDKRALIGKKPCARDGHGGLVYEDNIIIIGGDRHMMSFNDVYLFKMDKAIQNIHLYEDKS